MIAYTQCKRCVMDTSAENIEFDAEGNCNFCSTLIESFENEHFSLVDKLDTFVEQIKKYGKAKEYDCIVGLSGGADSSYSIYLAKKLGLRVLAVHMDNGWNSELATNNIEALVRNMDIDLYTHVIDWHEYKALMQAFFDEDVIDIELLYDNAMLAVNYQLANKYGIKYILSGSNSATEGMAMPTNWNWFKYDKKNIKNIAKKHNIKIKTFPIIGTVDYLYYRVMKKISWVPFLDYVDYDKAEAMKFLEENYEFKPYPYKHYESVFTRFYQGYILPEKFNVDKRKMHLSTLICTGKMTRAEALSTLAKLAYASVEALTDDKEYFLKKMGWSKEVLEEYIQRSEKSHLLHGTEKPLWDFCLKSYQKYVK